MGYNNKTWNFLHECFVKTGLINISEKLPFYKVIDESKNYYGKKMLELGCQEIKKYLKKRLLGEKTELCLSAREYFNSVGIKCISIDIDGCLGSLKVDLRKKIGKRFYDRFDIVTNIGTTEHIVPLEGQYMVFKNIHLCTKEKGIMIHALPLLGRYLGHCRTYYNYEFFEILAKSNKYKIILLKDIWRKNIGGSIGVCLIKNMNNDFIISKKEFFKHIQWIRRKIRNKHYKNREKFLNMIFNNEKL